ncbi:hypothetical protein PC129_g2327 [Phytophthora cactorum]|uniref:Uncharacterized protein n=1 Tax=Phytophthora cactorum TaxID=29920 RepID=A0A329T6F7_9STRA|nr:hypothetical protein Pcac1_g11068 [Phytophthora cactorum]KAG2840529.1 hypothetical protein PC111_g3458 [Phytophthora cactorum]KAG2849863.1 hypothetical protein PC112_g111 [Phytophthora cactorum]KAG2869240.1 hypothetical protein PC113_g363 [Phytophthora cactorum]KAG2936282.1 hypothetical protein PC114_g206 [Phytophthora cactorum]
MRHATKELKVFDGVFHPERNEVVAYVLRWLHR